MTAAIHVGADLSAKWPLQPTHIQRLTHSIRGQVRSHKYVPGIQSRALSKTLDQCEETYCEFTCAGSANVPCIRVTSSVGVLPNSLLNSRLNCEGLS